jgi:prophage regulatory protein
MRIIRWKDLPDRTGLKPTMIEVLIKELEFPNGASLRDGGRAIGWYEDEIDDWLEYRRAKRDKTFTSNYRQWLKRKAAIKAA